MAVEPVLLWSHAMTGTLKSHSENYIPQPCYALHFFICKKHKVVGDKKLCLQFISLLNRFHLFLVSSFLELFFS